MRRTLLALAVCALLVGGTGCHHHNLNRHGGGHGHQGCMMGCGHCGGVGHGHGGHRGILAGRAHGGPHGGGVFHGGGHGGHLASPGLHHGSNCVPGPVGWQHGGTDNIPRLPDNIYGNHVGFIGAGGPPSPTVGYPYYTTRGPRDFLQDNPPSIGR